MKNYAMPTTEVRENEWIRAAGAQPTSSALHLITPNDLEELRNALMRGTLPADLEIKLRGLAQGSLLHRSVEQNCRLFTSLLLAAEQSSFNEASLADLDRLLRVLAYVRKENDAIPDFKPNGFVDDQQEVRAASSGLSLLLRHFKDWRLRIQVPDLWTSHLRSSA